MIIKKKHIPFGIIKFAGSLINLFFKIRFNKFIIRKIPIKPNHSYLLMCNHFSFGDGFLAYFLSFNAIYPAFNDMNIMIMKKQLQKNPWLRYIGGFSIDPGKASVAESIAHAAEILSKPGNLLLFYPQGNLESQHVRTIEFQDGINQIIPKIKGDCQIIWSSNIVEYFESLTASIHFNMLDCGTNHDFNFEELKEKVNQHHQNSFQQNLRYTVEK
ncbi:MAG: 1-acyl-sn-glycerol-3-phosphate acyltransferase [Pelobium sp.]